jgi:CRISPR-associated protein Cas5 subtype I-B
LRILSFRLSGDFAAFRDPSVTSNQTVYYIPSKSAVVGLIGAMLGVERDNSSNDIYGSQYLDLYAVTRIGIRFESVPKKVTFYTNHRSLKERKIKPFKKELLLEPRYTIFVDTAEYRFNKLAEIIQNKNFAYSPYLGHAYCPAIVADLKVYDNVKCMQETEDEKTSCVILDESETYNKENFEFQLNSTDRDSKLMIERHLHHFMKNGILEKRVLKHWIPIKSYFRIEVDSARELSSFIKMDDEEIVCLY